MEFDEERARIRDLTAPFGAVVAAAAVVAFCLPDADYIAFRPPYPLLIVMLLLLSSLVADDADAVAPAIILAVVVVAISIVIRVFAIVIVLCHLLGLFSCFHLVFHLSISSS